MRRKIRGFNDASTTPTTTANTVAPVVMPDLARWPSGAGRIGSMGVMTSRLGIAAAGPELRAMGI